jgi:MOSC domain-containing protein
MWSYRRCPVRRGFGRPDGGRAPASQSGRRLRETFSQPRDQARQDEEGISRSAGCAYISKFNTWREAARRRQVHLIPSELFRSLSEAGFEVAAGDLGENITTTGLDLERMPLGTLIELGPLAMIELTGLRTPCVLIDRFQAGLKRQVLSSDETGPPFKCGVLGVVRSGGPVAAGDAARVRLPSSRFCALPAL